VIEWNCGNRSKKEPAVFTRAVGAGSAFAPSDHAVCNRGNLAFPGGESAHHHAPTFPQDRSVVDRRRSGKEGEFPQGCRPRDSKSQDGNELPAGERRQGYFLWAG